MKAARGLLSSCQFLAQSLISRAPFAPLVAPSCTLRRSRAAGCRRSRPFRHAVSHGTRFPTRLRLGLLFHQQPHPILDLLPTLFRRYRSPILARCYSSTPTCSSGTGRTSRSLATHT
jgi:hypothetical protein